MRNGGRLVEVEGICSCAVAWLSGSWGLAGAWRLVEAKGQMSATWGGGGLIT